MMMHLRTTTVIVTSGIWLGLVTPLAAEPLDLDMVGQAVVESELPELEHRDFDLLEEESDADTPALHPLESEPEFAPELETETSPASATDAIKLVAPNPSQPRYILGAGDQVAITVIGYEEFDGSRVVLPDGTIALPLIGSVTAAGKTADVLSADLTQALGEFLTNPVVNVSLTTLRPVVVNVAGDVYRPGPVQLSSLTQVGTRIGTDAQVTTANNSPTLASALIAAGGVRRTADIRQIVVQRPLPNGEVEAFTVNLWDAITDQESIENTLLMRDGDYIFVPESTLTDAVDPRLVATSSFAPDTVRVRVIGEVERPGEVLVSPDSTISSAVAVAGGPTDDARLENVTLVRLNEQGEIIEEELDLGNLIDDYQVQDGDVVLVAKRGYLDPLDALSRIAGTLLSPLRALELLGITF